MPKRPLTDMIQAFSNHQLELIRHAGKHKQEVIAQSLDNLREVLQDPDEHPYRSYVADSLVLLAYMEETSAQPLLLSLVRLPEHQVEGLIGVTLPNQLPAFLYKTCGKSVEPLKELVRDNDAYLYCRIAAMKALTYAAEDGLANAEMVMDFFTSLYTGKEASEADTCFWDDLTDCLCALSPNAKHFEVVRQALSRGLTSLSYIDERYVPLFQ